MFPGENLDGIESVTDVDLDEAGIQAGLELARTDVGKFITPEAAWYLWDPANEFSFLNFTGFSLWEKGMLALQGYKGYEYAVARLAVVVPDLEQEHVRAILDWLVTFQSNSRLLKTVHNHWSRATCASPYEVVEFVNQTNPATNLVELVNVTSQVVPACETVDLDPDTRRGVQGGFELNLGGSSALRLPLPVTEYLWNSSKQFSFLHRPRQFYSNTLTEAVDVSSHRGYLLWQLANSRSFHRQQARDLLTAGINKDMDLETKLCQALEDEKCKALISQNQISASQVK